MRRIIKSVVMSLALIGTNAFAQQDFAFEITDYMDLRDKETILSHLEFDDVTKIANEFTSEGIKMIYFPRREAPKPISRIQSNWWQGSRYNDGLFTLNNKSDLSNNETIFFRVDSTVNAEFRIRVGQYSLNLGNRLTFEDTENLMDRTPPREGKRWKPKGNFPPENTTEYLPPFQAIDIDRDAIIALTMKDDKAVSTIFNPKRKIASVAEWSIKKQDSYPVSFGYLNENMNAAADPRLARFPYIKALAFGEINTEGYQIREMPVNELPYYVAQNKARGDTRVDLANLDGPLTLKDINALQDVFLKLPLYDYDRHFGNYKIALSASWLYDKTNSMKVVDKLIAIADSVAGGRNDINEKFGLYMIDGFGQDRFLSEDKSPIWPHYRGVRWFEEDDKLANNAGTAAFSGNVWIGAAAELIATNPSLHDKVYKGKVEKYKGKTYRQISEDMIDKATYAADFFVRYWLNDPNRPDYARNIYSKDLGELYLSPPGSGEVSGIVPYLNRFFPVLISHVQLINALNAYDKNQEFAQLLDQMVQKHMTQFESYIYRDEINGVTTVAHPYALGVSVEEFQTADSKKTDMGHGSFELAALDKLYEEGYFSEEIARRYADTIAVLHRGNGIYPARMNNQGKEKKLYKGGEGYFWLARFQPELHKILTKHSFNRSYVQAFAILRNKEAIENGLEPNDTVFNKLNR